MPTAPGAKSFTEPFLGRSKAEALCTRECVLTGLCAIESSSFSGLPGSLVVARDGRERVVWSEDLEPFSESLLVTVVFERVESREGGGGTSGKAAVEGDCSLDEGTETTTGDDTAVPPGLYPRRLGREPARFLEPEERLSVPSLAASFVPPTDALMRLYSPLRPPCTSSMPLGSPAAAGAGGAVRSSKVVREPECDAVKCSWLSVSCSESRETLAMAAGAVSVAKLLYRQVRGDSGSGEHPGGLSDGQHQASCAHGGGWQAVVVLGVDERGRRR